MPNVPRFATVDVGGVPTGVLVVRQKTAVIAELVPGAPRDITGLVAAWSTWRSAVLDAALALADGSDDGPYLGVADAAWLPPLSPGKVLCVGSNYHDHVQEMAGPAGLAVRRAPFPFSFLKPSTALIGSGRSVPLPSYGTQLDWEAELAVVIGDPTQAGGDDPLAAVFGYTMLNDLSLRDFVPFPHTLGLDAVVSKGFDGAAPIGPWITLAEDVPDPQDLDIRLSINGEVQQDGSTASMIFGVADLIRHYAKVLTLEPGDVIATGTPAGVGAARTPPRWLNAGDFVEVRISGLGTLETTLAERRPGATIDLLSPAPDAHVGAR